GYHHALRGAAAATLEIVEPADAVRRGQLDADLLAGLAYRHGLLVSVARVATAAGQCDLPRPRIVVAACALDQQDGRLHGAGFENHRHRSVALRDHGTNLGRASAQLRDDVVEEDR